MAPLPAVPGSRSYGRVPDSFPPVDTQVHSVRRRREPAFRPTSCQSCFALRVSSARPSRRLNHEWIGARRAAASRMGQFLPFRLTNRHVARQVGGSSSIGRMSGTDCKGLLLATIKGANGRSRAVASAPVSRRRCPRHRRFYRPRCWAAGAITGPTAVRHRRKFFGCRGGLPRRRTRCVGAHSPCRQ